jgi:error-prone DNA polymerase
MPEHPDPGKRAHPWKTGGAVVDGFASATHTLSARSYVELQVTTNFSFLTGGSHPEEYAHRAAALGQTAVAITDLHTMAGVVRAHVGAKEAGIALVVGCRVLVEEEGPWHLLLYPIDRAAYGRLCRMLTVGKRRAAKAACKLTIRDVAEHSQELLAIAIAPEVIDDGFRSRLAHLREIFDDDRLSLAASCLYMEDDEERLAALDALSREMRVPLVATNDVHHHVPERRALQDVLTCVRHGCTIHEAGRKLHANAERHLKSAEEMARLFWRYPGAVRRTVEIANRCSGFSLDQLRYEYPDEVVPVGSTPARHLRDLVEKGALDRYPEGVPDKVRNQIEHELELIGELKYEPYFLTVHDIVVYARSLGILCQGRGAAANSAVCYCLAVTSVDPTRIDLLFERFISRERNEPPDIDIDFEHERREEVIQYIYKKYGRDRAALTAEVISYRGRSAVRDVGKAMGLSLDAVDRLAKCLDWWHMGEVPEQQVREAGFNPEDATLHAVVRLTEELIGFPRHLSQHVGGFVMTRGPLCESVPIENAAMPDRTVIEWDKDDIDALGMLKVDVLGLGMLTAISRCFAMLNTRPNVRRLELHTIPPEDPVVYDMICKADTIGVFQVESRAQMSMLPRLRPRHFYDLVIEVAIVRPGPIQGNMVHPYLRRRNQEEKYEYPNDEVKKVLSKTLGVPLFQEQAMSLAIVAAGFTAGEADQLRRAMAAWKRKGDLIYRFGAKLVSGMLARGYAREFAENCFEQIKGFSEYGFPESHAASFALLVYVSSWLKCHHPAAFAAAIINSQPMGFYAPAQLVRDAKEHGVPVREIDVNRSGWDCSLEDGAANAVGAVVDGFASTTPAGCARGGPQSGSTTAPPALRLGMRLVDGLRQDAAEAIAAAVKKHGPFRTVERLWRASGVGVGSLKKLAAADAFGSMGLDRQHALWQIRRLRDERLPLFESFGTEIASVEDEPTVALPSIPLARTIRHDYQATGMSLKAHPLSLERSRLDAIKVRSNGTLKDDKASPNGARVAVAGLVLVRQRPGTASGIVFMTIEDETGIANLILFPQIFERFRTAARHSVAVVVWGKVERQGEVVHVKVHKIANLRDAIAFTTVEGSRSRDFH